MAHNILFLCKAGDLIEVEKCLDEGIDPNFQNSEGESPLQIAAANGYLNLVSLLLKRGALIDLSNNYGWTPLMHAAKNGQIKVVSFLLKMKAKVNISNKLGVSAVVAAACSGNLSVMKMLAEAGAMIDHSSMSNDINACDLSTVMAASFFGHDSILQSLINNGIKVDQYSSITGLTPLMLAACNGHVNVISTLIENGADIQKKDLCGRTALNLSYIFNQQEVEKYLENLTTSNQDGYFLKNSILEEIKKGDIVEIESILEANKDSVRLSDPKDGITPLMLASSLGQYNIVNLLISYRANLNVQDKVNGWTALMHAVSNRHTDVVRLLLENGSDVNICASNGYTALDLAQYNDNDNTIIEMLTSCLAAKDAKSPFLHSPEISNRGRLSASERQPAKRSLSQTRVKDWFGGVAQHLQSKMLTRRPAKLSDNTQSIEITVTDESANEVFLEQTCSTKDIDKEEESEFVMLPPDLYLASALKEHKVEALSPPFPPIPSRDPVKGSQKKHSSDKNSKPGRKSLRLPNLLRNTIIERKIAYSSTNEIERTSILKERKNLKNEEIIKPKISPEAEKEPEKLSASAKSSSSFAGDLTVLLNKESLHKYAEIFRNQEVDIEIFERLTEEDLNEIGIENADSQEKLMKVIKKLQVSKHKNLN